MDIKQNILDAIRNSAPTTNANKAALIKQTKIKSDELPGLVK